MPPVPKPSHVRRRHFFRAWRKASGYSIEQAAEIIGMSRENLGRIERGEVPYDQDWLELAAGAYKCEPSDLIMRDPADRGAPWTLLDGLKPEARERAIKMLEDMKVADDIKGDKAA